MKLQTFKRFLVAALLLGGLPFTLNAQSYSIDWYAIAAGGGASTGGGYSVTGTLGQPAAGGPMTAQGYSLTGGFWALFAVPGPGAPRLTITLTSTNTALITWPSPSTGFILQQNSSLGSTNWGTAPQAPVDNGTTVSVVVNPPTGNLFYRLKK
jgi:hypothetical protein